MILEEEEKLTLEEALQHYGVLGMKWGVRRDRKELARASAKARGERVPPTSKEIKKARRNMMANRRQEIAKANTFADKAGIFLNGEFSNALSLEYRANPDRTIAFQMTSGEKLAMGLLAIPSLGGALAGGIASQQMNKAIVNDQQLAALLKAQKK